MKEKIFVSSLSYEKAKDTFDELSKESNFQFISVNEEEKSLAKDIENHRVRAFIADIFPYKNELYRALPKGGVIARYGVGYDSVDVKQASQFGLWVCNTPGVLDNAVAEHSLWLLGSCARGVHFSHSEIQKKRWSPRQGIELAGRNITLMGFGRIAQKLCKKLSFGLAMNVTAVDIFSQDKFCQNNDKSWQEIKRETGVSLYTIDRNKALQSADFVVVLMASTPSTKHIINKVFLAKMQEKSFLINPSRGNLVDEIALFNALVNKNLAGAALDVFEVEAYQPRQEDKDLRKLDNILMTSHIGSNTEESNKAMALQSAKNVMSILQYGVNSCSFVVNRL